MAAKTATATAEIVNLDGAIRYLDGLAANIQHTNGTEFEILLAGLANVKLRDPAVLSGINSARDALNAAYAAVTAASARLKTAHRAVAETVQSAGQQNVAQNTTFYKAS